MQDKISLVIMAAGLGSRYGGLKQMDPIDSYGNLIIDFSIYDAIKAGFNQVIFIIKKEVEDDFKEIIGNRIEKYVDVKYVFQELNNLPMDFNTPKERTRPWGTAHALYCCKDIIQGSFAAINADDYYGQTTYKKLYTKLVKLDDENANNHCMIGYELKNTLSESGSVARGVCNVDSSGKLVTITERTKIQRMNGTIYYFEDDNKTKLNEDTPVSMNLWGFTNNIFNEIEKGFKNFFETQMKDNPLDAEYYIPLIVDHLIKTKKSEVYVINTDEKWHGVTYKEDKESVVKAMQDLKDRGLYPEKLWE